MARGTGTHARAQSAMHRVEETRVTSRQERNAVCRDTHIALRSALSKSLAVLIIELHHSAADTQV
jgi:hypothetical protein